ncbi:MAG TPA: hypothetical protein VF519_04510 [Mycobacteriales bacterium]
MDEAKARAVVDRLRARGAFAHVHPVGVYEYSVRIVIPDGREAVWDADGAAGLEAVVLRDGTLVGLVEEIPGSADFDLDEVVRAILSADYDAPLSTRRRSATSPAPPPAPAPKRGLLRRLTGRS